MDEDTDYVVHVSIAAIIVMFNVGYSQTDAGVDGGTELCVEWKWVNAMGGVLRRWIIQSRTW